MNGTTTLTLASLLMAAAGPVTFDGEPAGSRSTSFDGITGDWRVGEADGRRGLLVDGEKGRVDYPLAIYRGECAGDRNFAVRFYPLAGKIDQAAGIAFDIDKSGSYFGVRANALEDNVLFFRVVNGKRRVLDEVAAATPRTHVWSTLKLNIAGTKLEAELNGKVVLTRNLERAPTGRCGLWSKADSKVLFDDFEVSERRSR